MDITEQPWAEFADRLAKELIEHGADQAAIITRKNDENRIVTNYFNCGYEERWVLIGHLLVDIVMQIIVSNAAEIKAILENAEPEEDGG